MRTIIFWRREKNGEIFNVKMFGKMKKLLTRLGVFSPHKRPTGERAIFQSKNVWKLIFNVKMFGNFFEMGYVVSSLIFCLGL